MRNDVSRTIFAAVTLAALAACGGTAPTPNPSPNPGVNPGPNPGTNPAPTGGSIAGSIAAPQGKSLAGAYLAACPVIGNQYDCGAENGASTQLKQNTASVPFEFTNMAAGSYVVLGWNDVNGSKKVDVGDHLGFYGQNDQITPVTPPKSGVSVQMGVVTSAQNAAPTWANGAVARSLEQLADAPR